MELVPSADDPRPQFVSLGAGVQSSALLLMLDTGALPGPRPAAALFADTGWEPESVYRHLAYLERTVKRIPIHRVSAGSMRQQLLDHAAGRSRFASPPLYVRHPGDKGHGQLRRQCTREFKIEPMLAWLRQHGYGRRRPVVQLLGITLDEIERISPSRVKWASVAWPLVHHRLTRASCLAWLEDHGHPEPPKSACIGCPFRSRFGWSTLTPAERQDAIEVDAAIRHLPQMVSSTYLHRDCRPLSEIDLRSPCERGQLSILDGECGGWCAS
jgi:hypothetical protein